MCVLTPAPGTSQELPRTDFGLNTARLYGSELVSTDRVPVRQRSSVLTRVYHPRLCTYRCVYVRNVCVEENKFVTVTGTKEIAVGP